MTQENEEPIVEATDNEVEVDVDETETVEEESGHEDTSKDEEIARLEKENKTLKIQKSKLKSKKEAKEEVKVDASNSLSQEDILIIARTDIDPKDMDVVNDYISKGLKVSEVLDNDDFKAIIERRVEARKVAQATNTGKAKSAREQVSVEDIREKAKKNFESLTTAEIEKLAQS